MIKTPMKTKPASSRNRGAAEDVERFDRGEGRTKGPKPNDRPMPKDRQADAGHKQTSGSRAGKDR